MRIAIYSDGSHVIAQRVGRRALSRQSPGANSRDAWFTDLQSSVMAYAGAAGAIA